MAVFSVKTGKASEEETRQARLSQEDLTWWSENSPKLVVEENRGKYIAVVNKEAIFGDSYQEAQKKAMAKYPDQRFFIYHVPSRRGKRIRFLRAATHKHLRTIHLVRSWKQLFGLRMAGGFKYFF